MVLRAMILLGFLISISGNLAACEERALVQIPIPGAVAPPKNSPLLLTTS